MARVAIVTGGTRGIGRAIAITLRDAGCGVVASYASDDSKAEAFTRETGIPARKWDVADFDACVAAVNAIAAEIGPVEILVNNAGITRDATMRKSGTSSLWPASCPGQARAWIRRSWARGPFPPRARR